MNNQNKYYLQRNISKKLKRATRNQNRLNRNRNKKLITDPRTTWCNYRIAQHPNSPKKITRTPYSKKITKSIPVVQIFKYQNKNFEGKFLFGVFRCGSIWMCPCCSAKLIRYRCHQLKLYQSKYDSNCVAMVTETVPHQKNDSLKSTWLFLKEITDQRKKRKANLKKFRSYRNIIQSYEITHGLNAYDITYTDANGWHLHRHNIFFSNKPFDHNKLDFDLSENWIHESLEMSKKNPNRYQKAQKNPVRFWNKVRDIGIKVSRPPDPMSYILKMGLNRYMQKYTTAEEAIAGNIKKNKKNLDGSHNPWHLNKNLLIEYYLASHGKRLTNPWPRNTFAKLLKNGMEDEDILNESPNDPELYEQMDYDRWRTIRRRLPEYLESI